MAQWNNLHGATPALIKINDLCSADITDNIIKSTLAFVINGRVCKIYIHMYEYFGFGFELETWLCVVTFPPRNSIMKDTGRIFGELTNTAHIETNKTKMGHLGSKRWQGTKKIPSASHWLYLIERQTKDFGQKKKENLFKFPSHTQTQFSTQNTNPQKASTPQLNWQNSTSPLYNLQAD